MTDPTLIDYFETTELTLDVYVRVRVDVRRALRTILKDCCGVGAPELEASVHVDIERYLENQPWVICGTQHVARAEKAGPGLLSYSDADGLAIVTKERAR